MLAGESARASKMPDSPADGIQPPRWATRNQRLQSRHGGDVGGADLGPNALLAGKADKPVELTLRRDGADRRAVVVPLASEHAARYYDLVARQRAAVCEASGGRLGYLNIPDMMARGWAEFHRDLYTEFRRDGLIMDLRDTQGSDAGRALGGREARPAHHRLERVPVRGAVELPGRFSWRWPDRIESYERGWAAVADVDGAEFQIRHGIGRRDAFGRSRLRSVTWVEGEPLVEGVEADDFGQSQSLLSLIKVTKKHLRPGDNVPPEYAGFVIAVFADEVTATSPPRTS